jgi:hypothetical protein
LKASLSLNTMRPSFPTTIFSIETWGELVRDTTSNPSYTRVITNQTHHHHHLCHPQDPNAPKVTAMTSLVLTQGKAKFPGPRPTKRSS